ncbi:type I restriction endonuclease, partial [Streptococcus suis]
ESNNFIVLDKYVKSVQPNHYQTEADLEKELISDLQQQGYEYLNYLTTPEVLLGNLREQMETLNRVSFTDAEWQRFLDEYLNKPSESLIDRTRKLHDDHVYDFI